MCLSSRSDIPFSYFSWSWMPISCYNAKSDFEYIRISDLKLLAYNKLCARLIFRGSEGKKDKWDDPLNHIEAMYALGWKRQR